MKIKWGIICLCLALLLAGCTSAPASAERKQLEGIRIVLDPGHGGFDGGARGKDSDVNEDSINLAIALYLCGDLEGLGADVVMTREEAKDLAPSKKADLAKRREIIENSEADFVISIHQNSHPNRSNSGPAVFYHEGSTAAEALAGAIQAKMNEELEPKRPRNALVGDYYILKSGEMPCVIVECGFLSNSEEERLLQQPDYQKRVSRSIVIGVLDYLQNSLAYMEENIET
ncbi:MAG: N-acetylmuramoyl-L-alanine amidase [Christensenellales bacterium]